MTVARRGQIIAERALAGTIFLFVALLFSQPSLARADDHRALKLLLDKGIITQQEYDQAVKEEQGAKIEAEQRAKIEAEQQAKAEAAQRTKQASTFTTKNGLQVKVGGFAEIDFVGDNTQSFQEIIGNRPVLQSNTVAGANGQFFTSPRNSRITLDVRAPETNGIKTRYFAAVDFLGNQPAIGTSGVSENSFATSPDLRIFQMFFQVESPVVDVKVGQDWSRFGFMSEYSRAQVSVAATPANMFNRWIQASVSKRLRLTDGLPLTPVFSVERPPQQDANLPSFVAGVQIEHNGLAMCANCKT